MISLFTGVDVVFSGLPLSRLFTFRGRVELEKAIALKREVEQAARDKERRELDEKRKELEERRKRVSSDKGCHGEPKFRFKIRWFRLFP